MATPHAQIRYHDDSLSDSSLVAVLCNMRAVAEDLLPRLIENSESFHTIRTDSVYHLMIVMMM